jgi:hypothetical protein
MRAGGTPCHLCHCDHNDDSRSNFWQQRNNVDVNAPAMAELGQEDGITREEWEGTENGLMSLLPTATDQSKLLPTTGPILCCHHF